MSEENNPIFYRSIGLIEGLYLPSEDDSAQGILMTDEGLFPTTVSERLLKFLTKEPKKKRAKKPFEVKHQFTCWVSGTPEAPYYQFHLIGRKGITVKKFPKLLPHNNIFVSQGVVKERSREKIILRIQQNLKTERTKEEIINSINYLEIRDCPGKVRTSQFWLFRSRLIAGFLHCKSAELIAPAKIAKTYLKIDFR